MKLLTKALEKKLPKLYSQDGKENAMVVCKFFTPDSSLTWFVTEGEFDKDLQDWLFFTKCYSDAVPDGELGYVSLKQLEAIKGPFGLKVERDLYFIPKPINECDRMS